MSGYVLENGVLGGNGIQIGARGMALFLDSQVVVVVTYDPFALFRLGGAFLQKLLHVGNGFDLAEGWNVQVDHRQFVEGPRREMAVPVDHPGDKGLPLQVHDSGIGARRRQHLGLRAHG